MMCLHAGRWLNVGQEAASAKLRMCDRVNDGRRRLLLHNAIQQGHWRAETTTAERRRTKEWRRMLPSSLSLDELTMGSCSYASVFSGGNGLSGTTEGMQARCKGKGVLSYGGCPSNGEGSRHAGWGACSPMLDASATMGEGTLAAIAVEPVMGSF